MFKLLLSLIIIQLFNKCEPQSIHESDINFRIDAGSKTCFFERGETGQMMEAYYKVLDGQHGDLDIIFEISDPNGVKIVSDYKKSQNSIIIDLTVDGDYVFCMDNGYSVLNSKLVFVSVVIENKIKSNDSETTISIVQDSENGDSEIMEEGILEWAGFDEKGEPYYIEVNYINESLLRSLQHVVKARRALEMYGAFKSRDNYLAREDTFIVDAWSAFQITFMFLVGMLQVYMIKQLFNRPKHICIP